MRLMRAARQTTDSRRPSAARSVYVNTRRHLIHVVVLTAAFLVSAAHARAEEGANGEPFKFESHYAPLALDSPYMTGDWGGVRTAIEDQGITTQLYLNYTYQWNVGGGLTPGGKPGASMDLLINADLGKLGLVKNGRVLLHAQRILGSGVNPWIGSDFQVDDDLDGELSLYLPQFWYEQELIEEKLWVRLGYLDYQTIVDRNRFANSEDKQFMAQALDNNPLLRLTESLGVSIQYQPCDWFSVITGIGDATTEGHHKPFPSTFNGNAQLVWFVEPALHVNFDNPFGPGKLQGNYRFGMMYDGNKRRKFPEPPARVGNLKSDDIAFYCSFDQDLFRENDKDAQGLSWFFRYAFRHGDVNRIQNFWSTGLSYLGPIPTRDKDTLGVAVYQSVPSHRYQSYINPWATEETSFEAYYSIHVTDWLYITPDVQYIGSPGIDDSVSDCIVLGVRTRISF